MADRCCVKCDRFEWLTVSLRLYQAVKNSLKLWEHENTCFVSTMNLMSYIGGLSSRINPWKFGNLGEMVSDNFSDVSLAPKGQTSLTILPPILFTLSTLSSFQLHEFPMSLNYSQREFNLLMSPRGHDSFSPFLRPTGPPSKPAAPHPNEVMAMAEKKQCKCLP